MKLSPKGASLHFSAWLSEGLLQLSFGKSKQEIFQQSTLIIPCIKEVDCMMTSCSKAVINANGSLTVSNLVKSDSGFYECLASNFHSVAKARAYLSVLGKILRIRNECH